MAASMSPHEIAHELRNKDDDAFLANPSIVRFCENPVDGGYMIVKVLRRMGWGRSQWMEVVRKVADRCPSILNYKLHFYLACDTGRPDKKPTLQDTISECLLLAKKHNQLDDFLWCGFGEFLTHHKDNPFVLFIQQDDRPMVEMMLKAGVLDYSEGCDFLRFATSMPMFRLLRSFGARLTTESLNFPREKCTLAFLLEVIGHLKEHAPREFTEMLESSLEEARKRKWASQGHFLFDWFATVPLMATVLVKTFPDDLEPLLNCTTQLCTDETREVPRLVALVEDLRRRYWERRRDEHDVAIVNFLLERGVPPEEFLSEETQELAAALLRAKRM